MLRCLRQAIWVALFACFLFVVVSFAWSISHQPIPQQQTKRASETQNNSKSITPSAVISLNELHTEKTDQKSNNEKQDFFAGFLKFDITDLLLAIFTGVLAYKTAGLFRETAALRVAANQQATDLLRSVKAAEKAATAAQTSAESLQIVERAYVYPIVISPGAIVACIRNASFFDSDPTQWDIPSPTTTEITFKIKNYGKTPAILKDAYAGFGIYPISAERVLSIFEAILGEMETTSDLTTTMQVGITRNQAMGIRSCTDVISFRGTITFDDIWGKEHVTDFVFDWDKNINQMALRSVNTKTKT